MEQIKRSVGTILVTVTVVAVVALAIGDQFCQQPGYVCRNNNHCNKESQQCECRDPFTSYDCLLLQQIVVPKFKEHEVCGTCNNRGTCYRWKQFTGCHCDFGFFGKNCEYENITVSCSLDSVHVSLMTPGEMVVEVHNHPECGIGFTSSGLEISRRMYKYERTFHVDEACAKFQTEKLTETTERRTMFIDIRKKSGMFSRTDYVKEVACDYDATLTTSVQHTRKQLFGVDLLNFHRNRATSVPLGEEFCLAFYPTDVVLAAEPNAVISIHSLSMVNEKTSRKMFDIVIDGCLTFPAKDLLQNSALEKSRYTPEGSKEVEATLACFLPVARQLDVVFDYAVQICDSVCPTPACEGQHVPNHFSGIRVKIH